MVVWRLLAATGEQRAQFGWLARRRCVRGLGWSRVLTRGESIARWRLTRPERWYELTPPVAGREPDWADVVVIGPGLGRQEWAKSLTESEKRP